MMIHGVALPILILAISFSIFPRIRVPSSVMHLISSSGSLPVFDMNFDAKDSVSSRTALDLRAEENNREESNLLKFMDRRIGDPCNVAFINCHGRVTSCGRPSSSMRD